MNHVPATSLHGTPAQVAGGVWVVDSESSALDLLGLLLAAPGPCGLDTETVGCDPRKQSPVGNARCVCWSVAWNDQTKHGPMCIRRAYITADQLEVFRPWLESADHPKVGHNIWRYDRHVLANHGIQLRGIVGDTLRMSQMQYNVKGYEHDLKSLSQRYLGYQMRDYADLFSRPKAGKVKVYKRVGERMPGKTSVVQVRSLFGGECQGVSFGSRTLIPLDTVARDYPALQATLVDYASLDAKCTLELYHALGGRLAAMPARQNPPVSQLGVHDTLWNPVCRVVSNSEARGITLDVGVCTAGEARARADVAAYEAELQPWVPEGFNWGSAQQLKQLLYGDLNMPFPPIKGTVRAIKPCDHGERSVAEASLYWLELNARNPAEKAMLGLVRKRRKAVRLAGYLRDLPGFVGADGRLHGVMGPDTTTGRLAVRLPPLQQMPGKEPYGIRRAFVAAPGCSLVVADYSQLEVYVLAHMLQKLFGDVAIANALASGDVYGSIACLCWPNQAAGVAPSDIKHHPDPAVRKLRDMAKIVVLATNYGKTPQGMAVSLLDEHGESVGLDYALGLLAAYSEAYPAVVKFQRWTSEFARKYGGIYTLAGRWRPIPEARSPVGAVRNRGNRIASNTPIQGSAMDIVGAAMVDIEDDPELRSYGARQLLQIHDEVIVEVPTKHAAATRARVDAIMTAPRFGLTVGLKVESKIGPNWGVCK